MIIEEKMAVAAVVVVKVVIMKMVVMAVVVAVVVRECKEAGRKEQ